MCPSSDSPSSDNVQFFAVTLTSLDNNIIPRIWILLDACSSINSMCNKDLINNIESAANPTRAWTNGGFFDYDKTCTLNNIGIKAYHNQDGIANILSMNEICKLFRIGIDTSDGDSIKVYIINNKLIKFNRCGAGVYYHDTNEEKGTRNKSKNITKR